MKPAKAIVLLFIVAACYDGVLGVLFVMAPEQPFQWFDVTPPNHLGYVQFPAALLLIFALMFVTVARDPRANRRLIVYGILLKMAYCSVAFKYWLATDIPAMWKPFAVIDVVMGVLFVWAYVALGSPAGEREPAEAE